jgi:hypothetical protein
VLARFLVRPLRPSPLEFELPHPATALSAVVTLDGRRVDAAAEGRKLRLHLEPATDRPARVVEVIYRRPGTVGRRFTIEPPRPVGPVFVGAVRWQVFPGPAVVPVVTSLSFDPTLTWGVRAGRLAPRPAWTTEELSRWFGSEPRGGGGGTEPPGGLSGTTPGLEPLSLIAVPRPLAVMVVSLTVLAVGLTLASLRWSARRVGLLLFIVVAVAAAAAWRPQLAAVIAASAQPGLAALLLAGVAGAVWRRRVRRGQVFAALPAERPTSQPSQKRASPTSTRPALEAGMTTASGVHV